MLIMPVQMHLDQTAALNQQLIGLLITSTLLSSVALVSGIAMKQTALMFGTLKTAGAVAKSISCSNAT